MFSKRSILDFQSVIREKLEILCDKIAKYAEGDEEQILCLNYAWSAWAGDLITEYAFGFCYNHLESPGFQESFHEAYMETTAFGHVAVQFPWVHAVRVLCYTISLLSLHDCSYIKPVMFLRD
jgi:hypothetical protein